MAGDAVNSGKEVSNNETSLEKERRLKEKFSKRKTGEESPAEAMRFAKLLRKADAKSDVDSSAAVSTTKASNERGRDEDPNGDIGQSKKSKSRQKRRRRERRQDRRSGPPVPPMDNRAHYQQEYYGGRHDPHQPYGNAPYPPRRGRGNEPVRRERGPGYHDQGGRDRPNGRYDYNSRGGGGGDHREGRGDHREDRDRFGRGRRERSPSRSLSRSRSRSSYSSYSSRSRSSSRSYSRSSSASRSLSSHGSRRSRSGCRSRSRSVSRSQSKKRSRRSHSSSEPDKDAQQIQEDVFTKEQRTVLVSQLVMKADDRDVTRYFRKTLGFKVRDVILLRDKRTGRHKGCAYVELAKLEDVPSSLEASGKVPDFQRFPILIKASESDKNVPTAESDIRVEAQKVYVGNVDQNVTQSQLYAIFSQFGQLERVLLQVDIATGMSKGFAFLTYHDPKDSNLAIVTMSGQILAAKAIKTGWANQNSNAAGLKEVQSTEFPQDSLARIEKTNVVFKQLNGAGLAQTSGILLIPGVASRVLAHQALSTDVTQISTIAEEAVNLALGLAPSAIPSTTPLPTSLPPVEEYNPKHVLGELSRHILVHNMFDKDEESEDNWADDVKVEFDEEGSKYGKIQFVKVMSRERGGKIYASFEALEGAAACADNLAGRWFDKRQLKVEFVDDSRIASIH